jgi:hypothetical protein
LLGVAIAAIVGSNAAFTQQTAQAGQTSTAEFLVEQIRELTALLPVSDPNGGGVYNFDDANDGVFNPPIDSRQMPLTGFSGYSQTVTVENVSVNDFQQTVAPYSSDFVRVTVIISYNNSEIAKTCWIRSVE